MMLSKMSMMKGVMTVLREKMDKLKGQIEELQNEWALCEALWEDFEVKGIPLTNVRTDAVYNIFKRNHPDIDVSQRKFSRMVCDSFGLKSVQGWLDGQRGSFYEHR